MWTIRDLGFAHRLLGRWKRNPNRDGHLSGKPWDGGHPVRRSGSITHWASAREHHSVLHLGWQTTQYLPRTTCPRYVPPSLALSLFSLCALPALCACGGIHTQRPTLVTHSCPPPSSFPSSSNQRPACVFEGVQIQAAPPPSLPTPCLPPFKTSSTHARVQRSAVPPPVSAPHPPPFLLSALSSSWTLCLR